MSCHIHWIRSHAGKNYIALGFLGLNPVNEPSFFYYVFHSSLSFQKLSFLFLVNSIFLFIYLHFQMSCSMTYLFLGSSWPSWWVLCCHGEHKQNPYSSTIRFHCWQWNDRFICTCSLLIFISGEIRPVKRKIHYKASLRFQHTHWQNCAAVNECYRITEQTGCEDWEANARVLTEFTLLHRFPQHLGFTLLRGIILNTVFFFLFLMISLMMFYCLI